MLASHALGSIPPMALVLLAITTAQLGSALAEHLFSAVSSLRAVALRLFFATAVLMLLWRPSLRIDHGAWTVVRGYGVILDSMYLCFYQSLSRIPLGIAVTTEFLGLLAMNPTGSRRWLELWAVLAGGGVTLLTEGPGVGVLFALTEGTCRGLYILLGAVSGRRTTEGDGLPPGMAVAALMAVPFGVADRGTLLLRPLVPAMGLGVALPPPNRSPPMSRDWDGIAQ